MPEIRGAPRIVCPRCTKPTVAERAGAQDGCDIYVCKNEHITKVKLSAPRTEWNELAEGDTGPT